MSISLVSSEVHGWSHKHHCLSYWSGNIVTGVPLLMSLKHSPVTGVLFQELDSRILGLLLNFITVDFGEVKTTSTEYKGKCFK